MNSGRKIDYSPIDILIQKGCSSEDIFEVYNRNPSNFSFLNKKPVDFVKNKILERFNFFTCNGIFSYSMTEKGKVNKRFVSNNAAEYIIKKIPCITTGIKKEEIFYYENGFYNKGGERIISSELQNVTRGEITNHNVSEVLGQIKRMTYRERETLFHDNPNLICLKNGILNIKTKQLEKHNPDKIFANQIPVNFDPNEKCKKIKEFINRIIEEEDVAIIKQFFGFILYNVYFIKKAIIFHGEKDTGKTTLINLIVKFIGQKNTSEIPLQKICYDKFAAAGMVNKSLNFYDDLSSRDINDIGAFKVATGGGYLDAEEKFGDRFHFKNYAKLLFATNKFSGIKETDDEAFFNRWIIISFHKPISEEEKNPNLLNEITTEEELSGLLNWALEGLNELLENNKFSYYETPEEIKEKMEKSSSSTSSFILDCFTEEAGRWISKEDMFNLYLTYCKHYNEIPVTKDKLGKMITQRKYALSSTKTCFEKKEVQGWLNLRFNYEGLKKKDKSDSFFEIISNKIKIQYYPKKIENFFINFILDMGCKKVFYPFYKIYEKQEEQNKEIITKDKVLTCFDKDTNKNNIKSFIKENDSEEGISLQLIINEFKNEEECNKCVKELLEYGEILEIKPNVLRFMK